jgi:hypothetical protein
VACFFFFRVALQYFFKSMFMIYDILIFVLETCFSIEWICWNQLFRYIRPPKEDVTVLNTHIYWCIAPTALGMIL